MGRNASRHQGNDALLGADCPLPSTLKRGTRPRSSGQRNPRRVPLCGSLIKRIVCPTRIASQPVSPPFGRRTRRPERPHESRRHRSHSGSFPLKPEPAGDACDDRILHSFSPRSRSTRSTALKLVQPLIALRNFSDTGLRTRRSSPTATTSSCSFGVLLFGGLPSACRKPMTENGRAAGSAQAQSKSIRMVSSCVPKRRTARALPALLGS
jgi:hypothetical protein